MPRLLRTSGTWMLLPCLWACGGASDIGGTTDSADTAATSDSATDSPTDTTDTTTTDGDSLPLDVLCINEVMSSNDLALVLADGTAPDWIELHNPGSTSINLGGWEITDDPTAPEPTILPSNLSIPAGGYLVLFADGDLLDGPDHVGFSLKADGGETLQLTDPLGRTATFPLPVATTDFAFARSMDCCPGDCWEAVSGGTPGASNE
jgi:hypothetical protein